MTLKNELYNKVVQISNDLNKTLPETICYLVEEYLKEGAPSSV